MTTTDIIHAYRHLYRNLLRAVQYAAPARFIARDQLRKAFRHPNPPCSGPSPPPSAAATVASPRLDAEGVKRTIWFLEAAAKERGLEHKILKNLLRVHGDRVVKEGGSWKRLLLKSKQM
ncbi:hypothetical protein E4U42_006686 [Claviceps africana]|uniref:DUF1763-domain-containing protein n=1 Tax=Claviceps africana TaxID=83212 RepID=A0A8K0J2Q0_9HYPO|nr:hypothetical protein E4U42_006686 [Claviceps africana]